jgi:hypothetical protein
MTGLANFITLNISKIKQYFGWKYEKLNTTEPDP